MRHVSVRPPWHFLRANKLFESRETINYWDAFTLWKSQAAAAGFALNTDDITPPSEADCVWMLNLPGQKKDFDALLRTLRPGTKRVLQIFESPIFIPTSFDRRNHTCFDRVLTYDDHMQPAPRYVHYRIPNPLDLHDANPPFHARRCAVMMNTNQSRGWMECRIRDQGLRGLPCISRLLGGWKLPLRTFLSPGNGELYSWRRRLARAAESISPPVLDVYGKGWSGQRISWFPRSNPRPYLRATHAFTHADLDVGDYYNKYEIISRYRFCIAAENFRGRSGYISEKPLDTIRAGSVPVYLGEEAIEKIIPPEAFVDARRFRNHQSLLSYLARCPEPEWSAMRQAGRDWLTSPAAASFSNEAFAATATALLKELF